MAAERASKPQVDIVRAIRDAALAGLLAFGLFLPLIGFQTVTNMRNELVLDTRWPLLAWFVAIVAGGPPPYSPPLGPSLSPPAARPAGGRLALPRGVRPPCAPRSPALALPQPVPPPRFVAL